MTSGDAWLRAATTAHGTDGEPRGAQRLSGGLRPFHTYPLKSRILLSHLPLTIATLAVVLLVWLATGSLFPSPVYLWGVVAIGVLTLLGGLVPWDRLPHASYLVLPLLDFVGIGAMLHGSSQVVPGISMLMVFPVLWMAWSWIAPHLMRVLAFVVPAIVTYAPLYLAEVPPTGDVLVSRLLVPVITFCIGVAATYVNSETQVQQEELELQHETVRNQRRLLGAIVDTAPVGVLAIDQDGRELLKNRQQHELQEAAEPSFPPEDAGEGRLLIYRGAERSPASVADRPVRRAARGEQITGERYYLATGDQERAVNLSARPMLDDDGAFAGSVLVFQDVTDLVAALAAQDEFVSGISHEFRTPLTSIIGYTDLLLENTEAHPDADPDVSRGLLVVQRNAERLLGLVDDLLGSASGVMAVSRHQMDLTDIARDCAEAAAPQARRAGLELTVEVGEHAVVLGDRVKLAQAVDNLTSNAIKYTPVGRVVIRAGARDGTGVIEVEDTGPGLTESEQARMFDRFYRTDSARSSTVPGSGLGMAVVRAIVDAHGGDLVVDSEPGRGTRMVIRVPLATP